MDHFEQNDLLEVFLHLGRFFASKIFEELADADFDSLLAGVHHVLG